MPLSEYIQQAGLSIKEGSCSCEQQMTNYWESKIRQR